ncbi:MAG: ribose 5-phosphate isomerase B [Acidobacteria bacterium]|nr:ribose 5-phosphate isomerase B [Acidobacteriota bacterium]MCB9377931.1 ribose 5-phosphate isomerase B [Holophagales bacterium]
MRIAVGADHAGYELKSRLVERLKAAGHAVTDCGTDSTDSVDYPDFAAAVAARVVDGTVDRGLLVCGSGIGMAIGANRHRGVRAVAANDLYSARLAREHNDANVLALGARIVAGALAEEILDLFLATPFAGGRHARRVDKLDGGER